ncbi:type II secretion system protein [Thiomicrorhabdus cannonii]|uniref:type II secretion system protein n=1 Tax=Thiomicrorhabdus cannonii TaxID=2748011 RepID=UPI0015B8D0DF|nr:type II secretion system protein [Thiomicrorhabdus cannonii]
MLKNPMPTPATLNKMTGFTLVELAVVTAILGIILIGVSSNIGSIHHVQKLQESQHSLNNIKQELLNFGRIHKYLPCPDSDNDGHENRISVTVGSDTIEKCTANNGTLPYLDLGLQKAEVYDPWNNPLRYAVNTDTTDAAQICDKRSSASFFCNLGANAVPWFSMTSTPPNSADRGNGNYYVCNQSTNACNAATVTNHANLAIHTASVVLVAFNQDGENALSNCAGQNAASQENCDTDLYYHQAAASNADNAFFDDTIVPISGYEIKAHVLAKNVSWDSFTSTSTSTGLTPTYEDFDITADDTVPVSNDADSPDVILVNHNVETDINLGGGDDYLAIGNNLTSGSDIDTGYANDQLYIVGNAQGDVDLSRGDDEFVLGGDLYGDMLGDRGDDKVWIQGNIQSGSGLNMGRDDDVLWIGTAGQDSTGQINASINGGLGYDILVLENTSKSEWLGNSTLRSRVSNFELVIFEADSSGNREYIEL